MTKLKSSTGNISHLSIGQSSPDRIVRSCILVHSGPGGEKIVFKCGDGEISFDEARIKDIVKEQNAKTQALADQYGGLDKMPSGACIPILDQHTDQSSHSVGGRLTGLLRHETRDVPGIGPNCACVIGEITFLGQDVVERVSDGRIYHLSIGIDESTNTLTEVSTVIEPAAPGAMVLKKPKTLKGEAKMPVKKLKAAHANRVAKLKAMSGEITQLSAKLTGTKENVTLMKAESAIITRLSAAMKSGKLTPAEFKKMDIKKLAKLSEESRNTVLETVEAMEPKVLIGQRGTGDALEFSKVGQELEKSQHKRLKAEAKADLKRMGAKVEMSEDESKDSKEMKKLAVVNPGQDHGAVPGQEYEKELAGHVSHMSKCLEEGDIAKCKEAWGAMAKHLSLISGKQMKAGSDVEMAGGMDEKEISSMEGRVDELTTQMARLAGMVSELMSSEEEEGKELAGMPDEEEKDLEGKDDDKKKELADKDDEEKAKLAAEEEEKKKKELEKNKQAQA